MAFTLAACSRDERSAVKRTGSSEDAMVAAWRKAGLEVSAFADADARPYSAQRCRAGTVAAVDVILCVYDTGEDAAAADDDALAELQRMGVTTGAALTRGKTVLVVADRRAADPTGRTVNAITAAFRP
jgi:pyridoxine 5'-phosphate synthase PdxJ